MKPIDQNLRVAWFWAVFLLILLGTIADAEVPMTTLSRKRVEIDKTHQILRAYEGEHLFLETRVSTGRGCRWTPNGHFLASDKQLMHYSRLFHHAPMPFSVQVVGNVFIHGFTYVPAWPDSHGCIRVPLDADNPARRFFEWVEIGTPIEIFGQWTGPH
jgi:lipoprotein-anchoring transpeptidase ErfK/SrfK